MHQIIDIARASFDAGERGLRTTPTLLRASVTAIAVWVLVWMLQPDLFGLVPNSLDPMFYTGYAINLDDALAAAGNRHYFVTRWTSYMPMYLFSEVFGSYWGRLILRLAMMLVLAEMFWRLGYRLSLPLRSRVLGTFAVLTAPMFVRAFTTDYPEYFIIWGSIALCLLVVFASFEPSLLKGVSAGVLASSILIANPFTTLLLGATLLLGFALALRSGVNLRQLLATVLVVPATGILVVAAGYLLFEHHYSVGNVYQPTLDFIRTYERPEFDGWTAPSRQWLKYFSWLYLSPILAVLLLVLSRKMAATQRRISLYASFLSIVVYVIHIYVEIQRGNALETSYYWSMSLGPVLVVFFLLVGFISSVSSRGWSVASVLVFCVLVAGRIPQQIQLPSGPGLFIGLAFLGLLLFVIAKRIPPLAPVALVAIVLWAQTGAPTYSQRSHGGDLNSPRYDLVYKDPMNQSALVLDESIWFLDQMDRVKDDWESTFLTAGGWSAGIIGTYVPHPFSRWIVPISDEKILASNVKNELEFGYRPLLVIYGDPEKVGQLSEKVKVELPRSRKILDTTHNKGLGYRLVVLRGNGTPEGESTIKMSQLDREIGNNRGDGSVVVSRGTRPGFVSFGPYFGLGIGSYRATMEFTAEEKGEMGYFEVFNDVTGKSVKRSITSNGLGRQTLTVPFEVTDTAATWQLRTVYSGQSSVVFHQVELKMSRESVMS